MLHKTGSLPESALSDDEYLRCIGEQVRDLRHSKGLNRKRLAERSGVSERFLAQLETGTGNISVIRLRHVAAALDCEPSDLLSQSEPAALQRLKHDRIALIGLRGAGKTTLGRRLAASLNRPFIELTECVERATGMSLSDIFNLYGSDGYRRLEQRELDAVIDQHDTCILATGGGVAENTASFERLLKHFTTIWLTATPQEHLERVIAQGDLRPMAGHDEALVELKAILTSRSREYARASHIVDTSNRAEAVVEADLLAIATRHAA